MEKCVECGVQVGKFEIFPGQICVKCYGMKFEKEWQRVLVK